MTPDQVVLLLVQDNIELACRVIEKAAMDRAVADVDENFAPSYELRRRHRQVSIMLRPVCSHPADTHYRQIEGSLSGMYRL